MNKEQILQNFGLTEAEVSLYITLLKLGESTASELSEKTNTNRTFTYDRLKKLLDSGLVSYVVKDNKKYFKAAEPSQLLSIIKESPFTDISLLNEEEKSSITTFTFGNKVIITLWSDVPVAILIKSKEIAQDNIKFFYNLWEREIKIYSGVVGIRRAWMELVLEKSKELVGFGFSWDLARIYGRDFSNKWHKQRSKNNIPARLISYNDKNSNKYFNMRMIEWKNFNISFLDKDICGPACITLSDNLIVTFLYTEKKFRVIVSKNKEMISVYRKHFETLWKNSKKS
jgi:predicted DNA-binding transcriptional regulator